MKHPFGLTLQFHGMSHLLVLALLAAVLLPAGFAATTPTPAQAAVTAAQWYDGSIQYSTITNCVSIIQGLPYPENGIGTYVGFLANTSVPQPTLNLTYYIHVVVAGMGNSCSGMRAYIDIGLPPNTSLSISGTNPVRCLYDNVALSAVDCTQALGASSFNPGMYRMPSSDAANQYTWPMPQGHILEIQIPVQSSTMLSNSALTARVWALDGNSSPWLQPQQGVYVFSSQPSFLYPSPSTTTITTTTAHSQAHLFTYGSGGTGYFDLGTSLAYEVVWHEPIAIPAGGNEFLAFDDWGPPALLPDTLYHWRFTFVPTSGSPIVGADQTFRTLPDGRVTLGTGTAASCTTAALNSALAAGTTKEILFNCGNLPTTLTLTGTQSITSAITINGGNKVILSTPGNFNHFNVQSGAHLTLKQIELANGFASCGGAVHVLGNGLLTLNEVRLNGNTAGAGGALCIDANGQAVVNASLWISNHASSGQGGGVINNGTLTVTQSAFTTNIAASFGGALGNYGTATFSDTSFSQNSAGINGGAIDTTVNLTVTRGMFSGNQSGVRGGAINNYLGSLTVRESRFVGNHSSGYGGAVANDAGLALLETSEMSGNTANSVGGALRNSGTLVATNLTVANNTATTNGGGIESAGSLALFNVTLGNNTSGGTGGNLYLGANPGSAVNLKNTLLAGGSPNNCDKAITSLGNNLESANTCGLTAGGDKINTNPLLGALQFHRAATRSYALLPGSPAIDAGTNSGCPATDQRGFTRPLDGDHNSSPVCDIGAFEYNPTLDLPKFFLPVVSRP